MPRLTDAGPQQCYVNYLVDIHRHYDKFNLANRRMQFEGAVRAVAQLAGLPAPRIGWGDGGGFFRYTDWYLELDNQAVTMDLRGATIRQWLYYSTMPYHELRHCEQFFLMAQAMLTGGASVPAGPRGRNVMPHGNINDRGGYLTQMGFPMAMVVRADQNKASLRQDELALVRAWVDSIFGRGGRARTQTLTHLPRGGKHMNPYINLPEEADAWGVERQVSRAVRARINDTATDEALQSLGALFGG